jgi:dephospho-CoA kinase
MNKIVAIVGMCGVGKSVASEFFENNKYQKVYFGGITYEKLKEAGIERTPESEKKMREELRKQYGMGCYAILSLPKIKEYYKLGNVIIDDLYSWSEYKTLIDEFGNNVILLCIVADKGLRYSRIAVRPGRSYNKEEAIDRDLSELENLEKGNPIAYADYYILNNGSLEEYKNRLEEIFKQIEGE